MTTGEIFLSPTGLSATTLLAPRRHISKMMSLWFISNALGQGVIALTVHFFNESAPEGFYFAFALVALVVGAVLLLLQGKLLGMAKGVR
jgi:POT family proton-dependent oligopeptide transporter